MKGASSVTVLLLISDPPINGLVSNGMRSWFVCIDLGVCSTHLPVKSWLFDFCRRTSRRGPHSKRDDETVTFQNSGRVKSSMSWRSSLHDSDDYSDDSFPSVLYFCWCCCWTPRNAPRRVFCGQLVILLCHADSFGGNHN